MLSKSNLIKYSINALLFFIIFLNDYIYNQLFIIALISFIALLNYDRINILPHIKIIIILFMLIPVIGSLMYGVSIEALIRVYLIIIFIYIYPIKSVNEYVSYKLIYVGIVYLFILQLNGVFGFGLDDIIMKLYPIKSNIWYSPPISISDFLSGNYGRYGGRFYNPNIMGQIIILLYIITLKDKYQKINKYKQIIIVLSLIFSGSRTAMIVFIAVELLRYNKNNKNKLKIIVLYAILFTTYIIIEEVNSIRSLDMIGGITQDNSSMSIKYNILKEYIVYMYQTNIFELLFGTLQMDIQFDSDIGYLLRFMGLVPFLALLYALFKYVIITETNYRYINMMYLISVGATLVMNFKFIILLIIITNQYSSKNKYAKSI